MVKIFKCVICGFIHKGETPPYYCPKCKATASDFIEILEDKKA